jgi:hypothetical protein
MGLKGLYLETLRCVYLCNIRVRETARNGEVAESAFGKYRPLRCGLRAAEGT